VSVAQPLDAQRHRRLLEDSYHYCRQLTRSAAKNFYYGLRLLPEPKRSAMFALYAYMRMVDDIADNDTGRSVVQRVADLEEWRVRTHACLAGECVDGADGRLWPAFADIVRRYGIPARVFDGAIAGQQHDLTPTRIDTFAQLRQYCHQVAGLVGVASIHIWGFEGGAETEALADARGVAMQLTNILRDLREDAARGRVYLPTEDLTAAGVTREDLLEGRGGEPFTRLMRFQIERAESYYEQSRPLQDRIAPEARPTLAAMTEIYHRLLRKVAAEPECVLHSRVSLSMWSKLSIGWRAARDARAAMAACAVAAGS
jgi:phytoene synthase